jgi:hypothetical protein
MKYSQLCLNGSIHAIYHFTHTSVLIYLVLLLQPTLLDKTTLLGVADVRGLMI